MNNRGFTLIEVLVVIVLVVAISVTVGINTTGMLDKQKEKEITSYKETIENAACTYAELEGVDVDSTVTINALLTKGYLKKDLKNPQTKETVVSEKNKEVSITYSDGEKKCTYN